MVLQCASHVTMYVHVHCTYAHVYKADGCWKSHAYLLPMKLGCPGIAGLSDPIMNLSHVYCLIWIQGHFRRGAVLEKLGHWEQALAAYFLCAHYSGGTNEMTPVICQARENDYTVEPL